MGAAEILVRQEKFTQTQEAIVDDAMSRHAAEKGGVDRKREPFALVIEREDGGFLAGMQGVSYYGCFHIELLLVTDEMRGRGAGKRLLVEAKKLALERGCKMMTLETMDFQAKPFYEKNGFEVEFMQRGFVNDVCMYFMKKVIC